MCYDGSETVDIIGYRKRATPVAGDDLYERMVRLVRTAEPRGVLNAALSAEIRAIRTLLPPEPLDPLLERARDIVAAEGERDADDGSLAIRAVHRALRESQS